MYRAHELIALEHDLSPLYAYICERNTEFVCTRPEPITLGATQLEPSKVLLAIHTSISTRRPNFLPENPLYSVSIAE